MLGLTKQSHSQGLTSQSMDTGYGYDKLSLVQENPSIGIIIDR